MSKKKFDSKKGILFWVTGLPGSGKTTIAKKFNKNIVGFDIKPEFPKNPDIVITNDFSKSIDYLSNKIFQNLKNKYKRQV